MMNELEKQDYLTSICGSTLWMLGSVGMTALGTPAFRFREPRFESQLFSQIRFLLMSTRRQQEEKWLGPYYPSGRFRLKACTSFLNYHS